MMEMTVQKHMYSDRQLRNLIVPLVMEQFLGIFVGMLDTMMVSSVGEAAISGVSLVNEVNFLVIAVMGAVATGGAVIVSQYLGYGDRNFSDRAAGQLVLISFLIPLVFMIAALCFGRGIIGGLYRQIDADVMDAAVIYFRITALSFPLLGLYNSGAALFRCMSRTNTTMRVSLLMNLINLAGNYIGIFILRIGVRGVAYPTLISRGTAAVIILYLCFRSDLEISLRLQNIIAWNKDVIRRILSIAVPNGVENGLFQLGKVLVAGVVATLGTSQIAANGVANSLGSLAYITDSAMGMAVVTVVGRCVGAGDYEDAKYLIIRTLKIAMVLEAVSSLLMAATLPLTIPLYTLTGETAALVRRIILIDAVATTVLHSIAFVLPNALRAAGDAKYTMYAGILSMFVCRLFGGWLLAKVFGFGVIGVWIGMFIDWIVRCICFAVRYRSGKWMNYRVVGN